jgi:glycosyltransferase involved in cell wall biosynthesis
MMSVSIVIPAWNETKVLNATLKGVVNADYNKKACEVIVVAGGDDGTYDMAMEWSIGMQAFQRYAVVRQKQLGKNAAIQQGIKKARKDIIVILDADTIISRGWLRAMTRPIEDGDYDMTLANSEPVRKSWVSDFYMIRKIFFYKPHKSRFFGNIDWGIPPGPGGIALKRSKIEGKEEFLFDINCRVGIDHLLLKRFRAQDGRIKYVEEARHLTGIASTLVVFLKVELRWLTGLANIEGADCKALLTSIGIIVALLLTILPVPPMPFAICSFATALFICNKVRMAIVASKHYQIRKVSLLGFVVLSYFYHALRLIAHARYFLGMSQQVVLSQGQR